MKQLALISGSILGVLSIVFGAFGAHALKKVLSEDRLSSFEVGVRYQMYAALTLLLIGYNFQFVDSYERWAVYGILYGCILFSGSIYLLSFKEVWKVNLRFLGPITPLGGLFMIIGWLVILVTFL